MERTLSQNEAKVVLDLEWRKQKMVTLAELRETLGASENYARLFAHRLVKKGWLERLRPGLFQLVPADRGRAGEVDTNPLAAGAVLVSPYFYSFGTACTHYGLTEQVFSEVYLACQEQRRPETIRDTRYVFVHVPESRFIGFEETTVLGHAVQMATAERAVLDAIGRPRYAGGIGEVSRIVAWAGSRVPWDALLELARKYGSSALVQRLGYFVDLHQVDVPDDVRRALIELVRPQSKIQLGSRRKWGTTGKLVRPWNVVENVPRDVLISKEDKPRRRVAYWIADEDVEQYYPVPRVGEMTHYAARRPDGVRQVFHHYLPDRTTQTRGVSAFVSPMETAGMGNDLMFAQLVKAQMAASAVLTHQYETGVNPPEISAGGQDTRSEQRPDGGTRELAGWAPAMETFGVPGETVQWHSPSVPNQEFFQHVTLILSILAVNLDLPVQVLMLDATHTNFSGWRGSIDQARQRWLDIQRWLIQSLHTPVYRWKVRQWAASDPILRKTLQEQEKTRGRRGGVDLFGHVWHPAGWPYIQPVDDATGDLIQIRNHLTSPRRLAARRGMDYEVHLQECHEDYEIRINSAQDTADRINARNAVRNNWVPVTWRDVDQPPMPEGINVNVGNAAELGAEPGGQPDEPKIHPTEENTG